jgi:hypothetical protein
MMIAAKKNQIIGRIKLFFCKSGLSPWTICTDCINMAYVSDDESVRLFSSGFNKSVCAFWICTLVSAESKKHLQGFFVAQGADVVDDHRVSGKAEDELGRKRIGRALRLTTVLD